MHRLSGKNTHLVKPSTVQFEQAGFFQYTFLANVQKTVVIEKSGWDREANKLASNSLAC